MSEKDQKDGDDKLKVVAVKVDNTPYESPLKYFECEIYDSNPLLNTTFVDKYGIKVKSDFVIRKTDLLALFFLKSDCERCSQLLPTLIKMHEKAVEYKIRFEIVNVSFDTTREEMMNAFRLSRGNWFAIEYDEPIRMGLRYLYEILAIPVLMVIDPFGYTITRNGVEEIESLGGINALLSWLLQSVKA